MGGLKPPLPPPGYATARNTCSPVGVLLNTSCAEHTIHYTAAVTLCLEMQTAR